MFGMLTGDICLAPLVIAFEIISVIWEKNRIFCVWNEFFHIHIHRYDVIETYFLETRKKMWKTLAHKCSSMKNAKNKPGKEKKPPKRFVNTHNFTSVYVFENNEISMCFLYKLPRKSTENTFFTKHRFNFLFKNNKTYYPTLHTFRCSRAQNV